MIYCKDCKFRTASNLMSDVSYCTYYNNPIVAILGCDLGESKIITNADRIRAMTDEELADWISNQGVDCAYCRIESLCYEECKCADCDKAWLKWLKQEADT